LKNENELLLNCFVGRKVSNLPEGKAHTQAGKEDE